MRMSPRTLCTRPTKMSMRPFRNCHGKFSITTNKVVWRGDGPYIAYSGVVRC